MKPILFFLFLCSIAVHSQVTQKEFDDAMQIVQGNDEALIISTIAAFEKKHPNTAEAFFLSGFNSYRDGNDTAALTAFSKAINSRPDFVIPYQFRAQIFSEKGMKEKAIADISEAIKLDPKNIGLLTTRSSFYFQTQQYEEGLKDMKRKIELAPTDIMGYYDAAIFSKAANPSLDADFYFTKAYAQKDIPKFVTDVLYGKFLLNQGRFDEAKPKYDSALATNEQDFGDEDFHDAAIVYYKTKNYDQSIKCYNKAISLMPNNVDYRSNLASLYIDLKDWQKVKETAEGALSQNSEDPRANMMMAIGLQYTGNQTLAAEYEAKAKRLSEQQ